MIDSNKWPINFLDFFFFFLYQNFHMQSFRTITLLLYSLIAKYKRARWKNFDEILSKHFIKLWQLLFIHRRYIVNKMNKYLQRGNIFFFPNEFNHFCFTIGNKIKIFPLGFRIYIFFKSRTMVYIISEI